MIPDRKGKSRQEKRTESESLAEVYKTDNQLSKTNRRGFLQGTAALLGLGTVFAGTTVAQTVLLGDEEEIKTTTGENGLVSTSHPTATEVGAQVLEEGGNAIDAAVATQAGLSVVEP